ncbi:hypothetical protein EVG20_g8283 [Dentipellis fragilis]|uniref:Ubiquitin-like protease family profile domain-containing protein n=1 Tax=Dentipellis fragilis TaxID=205917 RepID=A0A4Y9Y7E4_9AGAM|nr:hypothetical protein EVG20_g8283 [Dentipellis fragilis]
MSDSYSCGIIAINTLKHHLFGDPLWSESERECIRICEFLDIMEFVYPVEMQQDPLDEHILPASSMQSTPACSKSTPAYPAIPAPPETPAAVTIPALSSSPTIPAIPMHSPPPARHPDCPMVNLVGRKCSRSPENMACQLRMGPPPKKRAVAPESAIETSIAAKPSACNDLPLGMSSSAVNKQALNQSVKDGTFKGDPKQLLKYKATLNKIDPGHEIDESNPRLARTIRHLKCSKSFLQAMPYDTYNYSNHVSKCLISGSRKLLAAANTPTLDVGMGFKLAEQRSSSKKAAKAVKLWPCPGITEKDDSRIPQYLSRTTVHSAGSISLDKVAKDMFGSGTKFSSLNNKEKRAVRDRQQHTHSWALFHDLKTVHAIGSTRRCLENVEVCSDAEEPQPCSACRALLSDRAFLMAIHKAIPADENRACVPHVWQSIAIGKMYTKNKDLKTLFEEKSDRSDIFLRYARQFAAGKFDKNPVFLGLVEVMVTTVDRQDHGKGLQNSYYPPAYDEWCQEMQIISPVSAQAFKQHFPARSERNMRVKRSKAPQFKQGIGPHTLRHAQEYILDYAYPSDGPLVLAVDDTKLTPVFHPYLDGETGKYFIVGGTGDPFEVNDLDYLQQQLEDAAESKASKLHLWSLQIPLPYVPPLILALAPIGTSMSAIQLAELELEVLDLLLQASPWFCIISLASDGTVVEREARRELVCMGRASVITHRIPHPAAMDSDSDSGSSSLSREHWLSVSILQMHGQAIAVRDIAHDPKERCLPIRKRDVDKLDRQDDWAAARLFAPSTLEYILLYKPNSLGLQVFLFVFGELIDAYQNRHILHIECIKMVLRARFFKDLWKVFLKDAGYAQNRYYMSPECDDISDILINGLLALVFIYRDHLDKLFPLLLWLFGSESNEHIFGLFRDIIPDFNLVEALYLVKKIEVRLRAACRARGFPMSGSDSRKSAQGYSMTYMDGDGMPSICVLSVFPTDKDIARAAVEAFSDASALWTLLGYTPTSFQAESTRDLSTPD